MSGKPESPEEVQVRLDQEKRMRQLAEGLKAQVGKGEVFVFLLASVGDGGKFNSTSYVSTADREDSCRLLQELLDTWTQRDGIHGEPGVHTSSMLREQVYSLRNLSHNEICAEGQKAARNMAAEPDKQSMGAAVHYLRCAALNLAMYQRCLLRALRGRGGN